MVDNRIGPKAAPAADEILAKLGELKSPLETRAEEAGLAVGQADTFDGEMNPRTAGKIMSGILPGVVSTDLSLKDGLERAMLREGGGFVAVLGAGSFISLPALSPPTDLRPASVPLAERAASLLESGGRFFVSDDDVVYYTPPAPVTELPAVTEQPVVEPGPPADGAGLGLGLSAGAIALPPEPPFERLGTVDEVIAAVQPSFPSDVAGLFQLLVTEEKLNVVTAGSIARRFGNRGFAALTEDEAALVRSLAGKAGVGGLGAFSREGIRVRLEHPPYALDDNTQVVIGGVLTPNLDAEWHKKRIATAVAMGIDPYFWMAFAIEEYGGYRVAADHTTSHGRGLEHIAVGRRFVRQNGASGCMVGDTVHTGVAGEPHVRAALDALGEPPDSDAPEHQEFLDRQSFVILKYYQERILDQADKRGTIDLGMQAIHGYGMLPYLYAAGEYGPDKRVVYDAEAKSLRPMTRSQRRTGVRGKDHPIYGSTLAHFIRELHANEAIRALVPETAATLITDRVLGE